MDASRLGRLGVCSLLFALASPAARAAAPPQPRLDSNGDPLPAGAIARLGALRGNPIQIGAVAFTSDGRAVVSSGAGGIRRWNPLTGRGLAQATLPQRKLVAITPGGDLITTKAGKIYLWRATTAEVIRTWDAGGETITDAALSLDGKHLATGGQDRVLHVWDVTTGKEIWRHPAKAQEREVIAPKAFSPDGKVVAFLQTDNGFYSPKSLLFYDVTSGTKVKRVDVITQYVRLSPDFRYLAHLGNEANDRYPVCILGLARSLQPRPFSLTQTVGFLPFTFSADGRLLAASTADREVVLFESASGNEVARFRSQRDLAVRNDTTFEHLTPTLAFSPDGRLLLTAGIRSSLVWDLTGRAPDGTLRPAEFKARDLENLWRDLASQDAGRAWRAAWALIAAPRQAVALLARRLPPADGVPARLARLLKQLDSDVFQTRQDAAAALEKMEDDATPALLRAWQSNQSAEVRHRASRLLSRLDGPMTDGDKLREVRAVHVLEQIATPEARVVLRRLEGRNARVLVGLEAKAALQRLARRPAPGVRRQ